MDLDNEDVLTAKDWEKGRAIAGILLEALPDDITFHETLTAMVHLLLPITLSFDGTVQSVSDLTELISDTVVDFAKQALGKTGTTH